MEEMELIEEASSKITGCNACDKLKCLGNIEE